MSNARVLARQIAKYKKAVDTIYASAYQTYLAVSNKLRSDCKNDEERIEKFVEYLSNLNAFPPGAVERTPLPSYFDMARNTLYDFANVDVAFMFPDIEEFLYVINTTNVFDEYTLHVNYSMEKGEQQRCKLILSVAPVRENETD